MTRLISNGEQVIIGWHYNPAAADLDWLRAGDTLTLTFVAQVDDGHGNVGAQNLVITITGTNDVPAFSSVTNPADIFEIAGNSSAQDIPQQNGTIGITDQDLGDPLTVTVNAGNATALYNGVAVPAAFASKITALVANGAISFDPATSNGEEQTVNWHYNPGPADLDWLAQGDTLTITYVAHVNDGHGVVGSQNLVITIKGTNDAPVIKYTGSYSFDQFNTQDYGGWVEVGQQFQRRRERQPVQRRIPDRSRSDDLRPTPTLPDQSDRPGCRVGQSRHAHAHFQSCRSRQHREVGVRLPARHSQRTVKRQICRPSFDQWRRIRFYGQHRRNRQWQFRR